jgi:hypothetical protein
VGKKKGHALLRFSKNDGYVASKLPRGKGKVVAILNGWKEIATYMHRGVRTVQRWQNFGLPVRRPSGHMRSAVVTTTEELDRWLATTPSALRESELGNLRLRCDIALRRHLQELDKVRASASDLCAAVELCNKNAAAVFRWKTRWTVGIDVSAQSESAQSPLAATESQRQHAEEHA